jgi:hypothetical protein
MKFCKVWYFEISLELQVMLRYVAMNVLCGKIFKNLLNGDLYKHSKGGKTNENIRWKNQLNINLRVCNMRTSK